MSCTVGIELERSITTSLDTREVYSLLADVARSGSFFPKVERLEGRGNGVWHWVMEKIAIGDHVLQQTFYTCRYASAPEQLTVTWKPCSEDGDNAIVEGSWHITTEDGKNSRVTLRSKGTLTVDFPGFLEFLLAPLIRLEFESMVKRYVGNLAQEFLRLGSERAKNS